MFFLTLLYIYNIVWARLQITSVLSTYLILSSRKSIGEFRRPTIEQIRAHLIDFLDPAASRDR